MLQVACQCYQQVARCGGGGGQGVRYSEASYLTIDLLRYRWPVSVTSRLPVVAGAVVRA